MVFLFSASLRSEFVGLVSGEKLRLKNPQAFITENSRDTSVAEEDVVVIDGEGDVDELADLCVNGGAVAMGKGLLSLISDSGRKRDL